MQTKTPTKRLTKLVARTLRLRAKGIEKFNQSRETLQKAISAGLMVDAPIEIEGENFALVDNFTAEKTGGWATVPRFELKKVAKNPRGITPALPPDAAPSDVAHTAEVGPTPPACRIQFLPKPTQARRSPRSSVRSPSRSGSQCSNQKEHQDGRNTQQ